MRRVLKFLIFGTLLVDVTSACTVTRDAAPPIGMSNKAPPAVAYRWNGGSWGWPGSRGGPMMYGPMNGPTYGPMGYPMCGGMMRGMMGANPMPSTGGPQALLEPNSPDAKLFNHYCSQCHALPSPAQHTAAEWPSVVARMRAHMQDFSQPVQVPDPPKLEKIIAYLQKNAY